MRRTLHALTLTATFACGAAHGGEITRLVVVGDSLSDTGNTSMATFGFVPGSEYFNGRFSNGPVWVEQVATRLGLPAPLNSLNDGPNYAYGGAETGPGNTQVLIPNTNNQITSFLGDGGPQSGDLVVLFAGANNFFNGETNPQVVIDDLTGNIQTLAASGARSFLVFNYLPLGQVPDEAGGANEALLDALTVTFNEGWFAVLDDLAFDLDLTIHRVDLYTAFQQMLADPGAFGLTNVTDPAIGLPDATGYLFWDGVHPTTAGHTLIADLVQTVLLGDDVPGDTDGDGDVDVDDLVNVILAWGACGGCTEDIDDDGDVDVDDLVAVILAWTSR